MDVEGFCRQSRVIVVIGKGGVGKTTVSAALGLAGARAGLNVLIASLDDSGGLATMFAFDQALGYEQALLAPNSQEGEQSPVLTQLRGSVRSQVLTSDGALLEYLENHGLGRVSRRLVATGALDVVATAIPGVREVLVLGKLKQLERDGSADLIVLDAPASGHAVSFLTSSAGLFNVARGGPLRSQAEQVMELLADPTRCQALLVTIAEETPINEAIETAYRLEDEVGIFLGPVVVNSCYPELCHLEDDPTEAALHAGLKAPSPELAARLSSAARFRLQRQELQHEQLARLRRELPLGQLQLPYLFGVQLGPEEIDVLSLALAGQLESLT